VFLSLKKSFFCPKNDHKSISNNPLDLIISSLWSRNTYQSKFCIKSYDHLKLKWLDFNFYFFYLSSFFLISFVFLFLSLITFFYIKTDDNELIICEILVSEFYFFILKFGSMNWDEGTVRWKKIWQSVRPNVIGKGRSVRTKKWNKYLIMVIWSKLLLNRVKIYMKNQHTHLIMVPSRNCCQISCFKKWKVLTVLTVLTGSDVKFLRKNGFNEFSEI
jgi:hypothetical protein